HDFIKAMEAKGIMMKVEKNKNLEGYVEFAKEYGIIGNPFRGYAVKAEVASDLKDTFYKLYGDFIPFAKEYKTSIALWKSFKTIWNPTSHLNNILGNATFLLASGEYKASGRLLKNIFAGPSIFKHYKRYKQLALRERNFKDLNTKEKEELKKLSTQQNALLETLESKGYFDKSFLNNIVENYNAKHNGIQKQKQWVLKRFHNKLGNVYNAEDVLARMTLAQSLLEQGLKLEDALSKTSEILPDYSKPMPYWIKNLDRYGVIPFVQFLYHATPIMARQIDPRRIKSDKQVLLNILALGAYFAYAKFMTPMPDGYFGQEVVYDSSDEQAVRTIRVGGIIPHLQLLEFLPFSGNGNFNLGEWNALPEALRKAAVGAVPWQAVGLMQNHNYTFNRPITRRDGIEGALDRAVAVADFALPAPIGKGANALLNFTTKDAQNKKSKIHNERNPYEEALGFFGLNLKSFNARELEKKRQRDALKKAREGV
ncbi:hypothetical protein, partial [Helicobacter sp.]|uniref:hypothetical protein n=1 Tax=Helicobacter sp. TaxID=218 RepID=UPI002A74B53E